MIHAWTLEESHKESMLELECEAIEEEGWDCQVLLEACGAVLWACLPKTHGILIYPLHLLTGNVSLAAILGMQLPPYNWLLQTGNLCQQPTNLQCPEMPAHQPESNGSAVHPMGKQPH